MFKHSKYYKRFMWKVNRRCLQFQNTISSFKRGKIKGMISKQMLTNINPLYVSIASHLSSKMLNDMHVKYNKYKNFKLTDFLNNFKFQYFF